MKFFFNAEFFDNRFHGNLDAPSIKWLLDQMGIVDSSFSTWEDKKGMAVDLPEIFQNLQCFFRKGYQPVFIALGVTNMNPHIGGIDIANGKIDPFTKAKAHAISSEEKDFVAQFASCGK